MGEWRHGIFGCLGNCGACLCSYFLPCYVVGKDAEAVDDSCLCCCILSLTPVNLISVPMVRGKVRAKAGIDGSFIGDIICFLCCPFCTIAQMHQEVLHMEGGMDIERE